MTEEKKLDIIAVKTSDGKFYLAHKNVLGKSWNKGSLDRYLFDGKHPKKTFQNDWVCVESKPKKITTMVKQPDINHRYELQDKTLMSKKLPEFLLREEVATYDSNDYSWDWHDDMAKYESLYKLIWEEQPTVEQVHYFTLEVVLTAPKVVDPVKMEYKVPKGFIEINVVYQLADKVILPSILLPQRPCKLTSLDTYKIVRQYIKYNINPELATITSDYDFCFTVKRRIKLAEILKYTVDVNNNDFFQKRKRKPKYVERQKVEKEEVCFEMTHAPDSYRGYTPIEGFEADTQEQLKEKIDAYCKDVVAFINTPLVECDHCSGYGIIKPAKRKTNERAS